MHGGEKELNLDDCTVAQLNWLFFPHPEIAFSKKKYFAVRKEVLHYN